MNRSPRNRRPEPTEEPADEEPEEPAEEDTGFDTTSANDSGPNLIGPNGTCLAVPNTLSNGDLPSMQTCDGSVSQRWIYTDRGTLTAGNLCLDLGADDVSNGHQVQLWECNNSRAQLFRSRRRRAEEPLVTAVPDDADQRTDTW